jgi:NAD(P)-dependent dehydrogenase (short-subunit alcohol dehydrogenase family)
MIMPHALPNRIALITGASRGIGQAVAKRFVAEGAQVILAARDRKGLEETSNAIHAMGGEATLVELDVTEPEKMERLAEQIAEQFGKLDILVGNAGILGELTPLPHLSPEIWDQVIATNLTANFHLIRCFDTLLKASDAPRAMFVTSGVAEHAMAYWGAYATSKLALEMLVRTYAAENVKTSLRVNLISPGEVRTQMHAQAMPGADPMQFPAPESVTNVFVKLAGADCKETGKKFYAR